MGLVTEYKCPGCGAPLAFDAESGKVKCEHCLNEYSVEQVISFNEAQSDSGEFDWGYYKDNYVKEQMEQEMVIYKCQSCGAEIASDPNTIAAKCPYCDSNVVVTDRVSGGLKPNCLIPFQISKKQLPELLKNFYKSKKYLPDDFFTENQIEKTQGLYVPFWLFNCELEGSANFTGTRVISIPQGHKIITTTSTYLIKRGGRVEFDNLPVDASVKIENDLMDSIEPFDYSKLVPFDGAYLSGFVAERFDSDPDSELPRATERTMNSVFSMARNTVTGFSAVSPRSNDFKMVKSGVKYALLPVYIFNCKYNGQNYRYAVNGQTGKVVGELPISDKKLWRNFFITGGITAAVIFALMMLI